MIYYEIDELMEEYITLITNARSRIGDFFPLTFMDYVKLRLSDDEAEFIDDKHEWHRIREYRKKNKVIKEIFDDKDK